MSLSRYLRRGCASMGLALLIGSIFLAQTASAGTRVRPISDFVSAQGSFHPGGGPVGALFIWGNSFNELFRVDYPGTDDKGLISVGGPNVHTSFSGAITETTLADGRVLDTIHLVTNNAIAYVVDASNFPCPGGFIACPTILGYNFPELANGIGSPVLANSVMDVTLINTGPGAPIPDLVLSSFTPSDSGAYVKTITIRATTVGPLRAPYFPEGTRGLAKLNASINTATNLDDEQVSVSALGP